MTVLESFLMTIHLAGPAQVFHAAARLGMPYRLIFCALQPEVCSAQGLVFGHLQLLAPVQHGDLVIVPGLQLDREMVRRGIVGARDQSLAASGL